jgi:hypothetical protein
LPGSVGFRLALFFCRLIARDHGTRLLLHRGVAFQIGLLFDYLAFECLAIDAEEKLAFAHALSFRKGDPIDLSGHARLHLNVVHRLDIANGSNFQRDIFRDCANRANRYGLGNRVRLSRYASAGCQRKASQCRKPRK